MRLRIGISAIGLLLLLTLPVNSQTALLQIDTTPTDSSGMFPFGTIGPDTGSIYSELGQTFTTGSTSTPLVNFTLWLDDGISPLTFKAVVREWQNGSLGPVLYESAPTGTTNNDGLGGYEQLTFFPENVTLGPDTRYVAYLSTSDLNAAPGRAVMPTGTKPYGTPIPGGPDTLGRWVAKYPFQEYWLEVTSLPYNDVAFQLNALYSVCLLYDPASAFKSGKTARIELQLCDRYGNNLSSAENPIHALSLTYATQISGFLVQAQGSGPTSNGEFRFRSNLGGSGGYVFHLDTAGLGAGTYHLNFKADNDLTTYQAIFVIR